MSQNRRKLFSFVMLVFILLSTIILVLSWGGEAATVAQENFGPRAAVERYEWFKDAAAQLGAQRQNIENYEQRLFDLEAAYENEPRSAWDRTDKETYRQWSSELMGVKSAYNVLAAEYNANMAKINYRYANVGEVPAGEETLPRDFRAYQ